MEFRIRMQLVGAKVRHLCLALLIAVSAIGVSVLQATFARSTGRTEEYARSLIESAYGYETDSELAMVSPRQSINNYVETESDTDGDGACDAWSVAVNSDEPYGFTYTGNDTTRDGAIDQLGIGVGKEDARFLVSLYARGSRAYLEYALRSAQDNNMWHVYSDLDFDGIWDVLTVKSGTEDQIHSIGRYLQMDGKLVKASPMDGPIRRSCTAVFGDGTSIKVLFQDGRWIPQ